MHTALALTVGGWVPGRGKWLGPGWGGGDLGGRGGFVPGGG